MFTFLGHLLRHKHRWVHVGGRLSKSDYESVFVCDGCAAVVNVRTLGKASPLLDAVQKANANG